MGKINIKPKTLCASAPPQMEAILGSLGIYPSPELAVCEIVDNGAEYGPTSEIRIFLEKNRIIIADDGRGLNKETMREMFQIHRREHEKGATGKYGYGFKASSYFLSDQTAVLSKQGKEFVFGNWKPTPDWKFPIESFSKGEKHYAACETMWDEYRACDSDSGTIVILDKLKFDLHAKKNKASLIKELGQVYGRLFPKKNITLYVNDEVVPMTDIRPATIISDFNEKPFSYEIPNERKTNFTLTVGERQKNDPRGVVIYRNNRLITKDAQLGINYISQPKMKPMQIIINTTDENDDLFKMTPMKTIDKNQKIDADFYNVLVRKSGLLTAIKKYHQDHKSEEEKSDLSPWRHFLQHLAKYAKRYDPIESLINCNKQNTRNGKRNSPSQPAPKKPPAGGTKKKALCSGLENFKGVVTIELLSLGLGGPQCAPEVRQMRGGKPQIVLMFNNDVPFVKELIKTPTSVSKLYVREEYAKALKLLSGKIDEEELKIHHKVQEELRANRDFITMSVKEINTYEGKQ